eukprot:IDg18043t1
MTFGPFLNSCPLPEKNDLEKSVKGASTRENSFIKMWKNGKSPINPLSSVRAARFSQKRIISTRTSPTQIPPPLTVVQRLPLRDC